MRWWPWRSRPGGGDAPDELLRKLFGESAVGVVFVDANRRILSANKATLALIEEATGSCPFGIRCGVALSCPLGTACPMEADRAVGTSGSVEAPVFARSLRGPHGGVSVLISCHRLPAGPRMKIRGMVVVREMVRSRS